MTRPEGDTGAATALTPRSIAYLERIATQVAGLPPARTAERIRELVTEHEVWRAGCLNLLAAENTISRNALAFLSSAIATRLTEGLPGDKEFPPPRHHVQIDEIEATLIALVKRLIPARFVEWRPTSNTMANMMALEALTSPGDRILVQSMRGGANMSYHPGAVPDLLGLSVAELPPGPELDIDLDAARSVARQVRPAVIMVGGGYMIFPLPVAELRAIANEVGAALVYDAAHVGLLIGLGLFQDPLSEGADILTMGTHKVMGGPVGGLVLTNREDLAARIINRAHPLFIQTRDQNKYASAAYALAELAEFGSAYGTQMVTNAKRLALALEQAGFTIVGASRGYTMTHQVIVDVQSIGGPLVERLCQDADILLHKARLRRDGADREERSGLRITVQEVTRQGMKEPEMDQIAQLIGRAVFRRDPASAIAADVKALVHQFATPRYTFGQTPL